MASSHPPKRNKTRRSWFDTPPLTTLDPLPAPNGEDISKRTSLDVVEILTLTHFTNPPRLIFGKTCIGKTKRRTLLLRNPHGFGQEVIIEKFPYKKKFMVNQTRFTVGPEEVFSLEITWTPEEDGGCREMIQFHINDVYRLQAFVIGTANKPKPLPRKIRKFPIAPCVRQPPTVLQTPALTNIRQNYSPTSRQEADKQMEDLVSHHHHCHKEDKENNGDGGQQDPCGFAGLHNGAVLKWNNQAPLAASKKTQTHAIVNQEEEVVQTPNPLESTTIVGKQDQRSLKTKRQWRHISDITSPTLNMSPIPVSEGHEHGIIVDSYFQPNDINTASLAKPDTLLKDNISKDIKISDKKLCEVDDINEKEIFLRPLLPFDSHTIKGKSEIVEERASESKILVSSLRQQHQPTANSDETRIIEQHEIPSNVANLSVMPESSELKAVTMGPEHSGNFDMNKTGAKSNWSPPKLTRNDLLVRASEISPRTMLDESLTLISQMRVRLRSTDSSPNTSINSSLISQGQGIVSPNSFMEDMRSMVQHDDDDKCNNTGKPDIPCSSLILNNSIPRKIMIGQSHGIRRSLHNSPLVMNFECGTPRKSQAARLVGPSRRSISSQFQREEMRKISAAAGSLRIKDKELLNGTSGRTKKGQAAIKKALMAKRQANGCLEHTVSSQRSLKNTETKRTAVRRSPLGKRSLVASPLTKKCHLGSTQDFATKRTRNKLGQRKKSSPLKPVCETHISQMCSTTSFDRTPPAAILAETKTPTAPTDNCHAMFTFVTPQKDTLSDSYSETHSRSIDSGTVIKVKSLENTTEISGHIFTCLFQDEDGQRMDASQNISSNRHKLFPDILVVDDTEVDSMSHVVKNIEKEVDTSQIVFDSAGNNKVEDQGQTCTNDFKQQLCQNADKTLFDRMAVAGTKKCQLENVFSEAETLQDFSAITPNKLPTSPAISLDHSKRGTITLSKLRISDALTTALDCGKRLFQTTPKKPSSCCITTDDTETQENIRVDIEEHYQEIDGNMYVVVKETTNVTKSTTETYMEHLAISPQQFHTPTRLPNSPDFVMTRRSTHVVKNPSVINVASFNKRQIDFIEEEEVENHQLKEGVSLHPSELQEEGDITAQNATHDNSDMKCSQTTSDTFEKESTFLAGSLGYLLEDKLERPITSVCAMLPNLVDYENGSESGDSQDVTKDSLDINQSLDSLVSSVAQTSPCLEESKHRAELERNVEEKATSTHQVEECISLLREQLDKCQSERDSSPDAKVLPISSRKREKCPTVAIEESEDEQFYDTMSERYYDALSDAVQPEVGAIYDPQETAEPEQHQKSNSWDRSSVDADCKCFGNKSHTFEVGLSGHNSMSLQAIEPLLNAGKVTEQTSSNEMSIDHKEQFKVIEREIFDLCAVSELEPVEQIIRSTPEAKIKRKLRRSVSADTLLENKLIKHEPDTQKYPKTLSLKSSVPKTVTSRKPMTQSKTVVFTKCAVQLSPSFPPRKTPGEAISPRMRVAMKLRSQSLSNLAGQAESSSHFASQRKGLVNRANPATQPVPKQKMSTKGVAQGRLILIKKKPNAGIPRHPMLFAAKNMYYDERWMEKQERGFIQWLNFVLTPPDEYVAVTNKTKIDAGSLSLDTGHVASRLAPTKEKLSFRSYAARRRLNRLRRSACELYQSEQFVNIICKIEVEVESRRICVRKDRMVHADVGIKQKLLDLLLNYSSLWLRIGLETVFGEVLMLQSNQDVLGLSKFILTRLLASPDIAAEFSHPTVPHLYKQGYVAAASRHIVKKFLLLVYFLDRAKSSRLIDHDPCLFCKDAGIKSSKEILIELSREVLSGEGDITRHLAYLGYVVCQSQKPIEEFDFAVVNLSSDLRDGLRLCRVLELLAGDHSIMTKLRTPSVSRLQKIHNTGVFFKAMCERGLDFSSLPGTVLTAKDIVDGHREKTLALLWQMIIYFQGSIQVNEAHLKEEIDILNKSLQLKVAMQKIGAISMADCEARRDSGETKLIMENKMLQLILEWCRLVCLHYGVKVENFTVSFSDGRALCCLVHHYHPALLPISEIHFQTTISFQETAEDNCQMETNPDLSIDWGARGGGSMPDEDNPEVIEQLLTNEKSNYRTLFEKVSALGGVPLMLKFSDMSNTIPNEKVVSTFVSYLCARLLDVRQEVRAARILQMVWRKKLLLRAIKKRQVRTQAAVTIQRWIRTHLVKSVAFRECCAATCIQSAWRGHCARVSVDRMKLTNQEAAWKERQEQSTILQQSLWQSRSAQHQLFHLQEKQQQEYNNQAVITIQKHIRGLRCRREFLEKRTAAIKIQSMWRRFLAQKRFSKLKQDLNHSAVVIQKWMKRHVCMCRYKNKRSSVVSIQKCWRRRQAMLRLCFLRTERKLSQAATTIQKFVRTRLAERKFQHHRQAAIVLQSCWRGRQARIQFAVLKKSERENTAAILIQSVMRSVSCRHKYLRSLAQLNNLKITREKAAVVIQKYFRGYRAQSKFRALLHSAIIVQKTWRMLQTKRNFFILLNQKHQDRAAVVIQHCYRRYKYGQGIQKRANATLIIQKSWRMYTAKKILSILRQDHQVAAAVTIQRLYRGFLQRQKYAMLRSAVTVLQKYWRRILARRCVDKMRDLKGNMAALILQKNLKMWKHRRYFLSLKAAVTVLQNTWRMVRARRCLFVTRQERSAMIIQKMYRGYVARHIFMAKRDAALKIQSFWRMSRIRKQFSRFKEAASFIQVWHRSNLETKRQRSVYVNQRKSVIYIQSWWRCHALSNRFHTMKLSAISIQRSCRAHRCRQKFLTIKSAALTIQRRYRLYLEGLQVRTKYLTLRRATIIIQQNMRRYFQQKQVRQEAAALVLQTAFRKSRALRTFVQYKLAATIIQRQFRDYVNMKSLRQRFLRQRQAACVIQRVYRTLVLKRQYHQCIIKIQSHVRGRIARSHFEKQKNAAIIIQRKFRTFKTSQDYREAFLQLKISAVIIQRFYRAGKARRMVQTEIAYQHSAATKIQAVYRSWSQRQDYLRLKIAVVCFQRRYRSRLAGRAVRNRLRRMTESVCTIQRSWRLYKQMCDAKGRVEKLRNDLKVRQYEEKLLNEREEKLRNELKVRQYEEKLLNEIEEKRKKDAAASVLQRSLRAYLTVKSNLRRARAAQVIQKHVRGYQCRLRYCTQLQQVLYLQRMVRGFVDRRRYERMKLAARIIQSRWREILEGRRCRSEFNSKLRAVVKIQACFLMMRHRKMFLAELRKVVVVQAHIRASIQRHRFKCSLKSVVGMQRKVRGNQQMRQDRERFLKFRHCAIQVQTVVRLWLAYRRVQKIYDLRVLQQPLVLPQIRESVKVQTSSLKINRQQLDTVTKENTLVPTQSHLQGCQVETLGTSIIQRTVQCFLNIHSQKQNHSAFIIQKALRRYVLRQRMVKTQCAVMLQTHIRMLLCKRYYLAKHRAVVSLQAAVRGWHARILSMSLRKHQAALCLQASFRGFLVRKKLSPILKERLFALQEMTRHNRAARKIQALWRGFLTRRNTKDKKLTRARKRLQAVNQGATSEKTLGSRTSSALDYLLREKDLSHILESLMHLEVCTRLSPKCCEKMAEVNAVSALYRLINSCNRSIPHMELIKYCVNILLNLAKYERTIAAVIEPQESISSIVELMQIYREKGSIFSICCMLLWILALQSERRALILKYPLIVERLQSFHVLALRKQRTCQNRQVAQAKMAAMKNVNCSLSVLTPSKSKRRKLHPAWALAGDSMKDFDDPVVAVLYVMDALQIRPKI